MADNLSVIDSGGVARTVGAKDLSSVYLPKHVIVDDAGDIALVSVANAALAENAAKFLQTASALFGTDTAAAAASQLVPVSVESTAAPNIRAALYNGTAKIFDAAARPGYVRVTDGTNNMPSMDAVARPGFIKLTDGTNTAPTMDAAARPGFFKLTDGTNTAPTMDAAARPGFQKITDGTNTMPTMDAAARPGFVKVTDGTNTQPTGDVATRPIFVTLSANAANAGSLATQLGLVGTAVAVKASAGTIYSITVTNSHSATQFLQLFNLASGSVTPGTTTPDMTIAVPNAQTVSLTYPVGLTFGTAISMIATTTRINGTAATASTMDVTIGYK